MNLLVWILIAPALAAGLFLAGTAVFLALSLPLAAWAQGLTARRFGYSRRNPWDSPERCFERGYGYCIQQARSLKLLFDALGVESRLVRFRSCIS